MTFLPQDIATFPVGLVAVTIGPEVGRWLPTDRFDPRVRLAICSGPKDAPRVPFDLLRRARHRASPRRTPTRCPADGPAAALKPRSASRSSRRADGRDQGAGGVVRAALEASGLDDADQCARQDARDGTGPGPIDRVAGRIFREAGVARLEPKKKPRSAWRRSSIPRRTRAGSSTRPNTPRRGRKCVFFELIDDHSRYAPARTSRRARPLWPRHGVRQGRRRARGPAAPAVGQQPRAEPDATGPGPIRRPRIASGGRGDHRQALQADHAGQELNASTRRCSATSTGNPWPRL